MHGACDDYLPIAQTAAQPDVSSRFGVIDNRAASTQRASPCFKYHEIQRSLSRHFLKIEKLNRLTGKRI
jgi:hypothetical protein